MKLACLALGLALGLPVAAEEAPAKKKKPAAAKKMAKAHQKPTPEQIRRFNELQKNR